MSAKKTQEKKSPPREERGGEQEGFPIRQPRGGTHRVHDRALTAEERHARQDRRADARQKELDSEEEQRAAGPRPGSHAARRKAR